MANILESKFIPILVRHLEDWNDFALNSELTSYKEELSEELGTIKDEICSTSRRIYNEKPLGVKNKVNLHFTLSQSCTPRTTVLFLNGLRQCLEEDYLEVVVNDKVSSINFTQAPYEGDVIIIDYTY